MGEQMKGRNDGVNWDGDVETLRPYVDRLRSDSRLADHLFVNRQEAFEAGLWIGRHADHIAGRNPPGTTQGLADNLPRA